MSTTTLTYPNTIQFRRGYLSRWLAMLIISLALIASAILMLALSATGDTHSGNLPSVVIAVPVPIPPTAGAEILPAETPAPDIRPDVIAIPVPTAPSQ